MSLSAIVVLSVKTRWKLYYWNGAALPVKNALNRDYSNTLMFKKSMLACVKIFKESPTTQQFLCHWNQLSNWLESFLDSNLTSAKFHRKERDGFKKSNAGLDTCSTDIIARVH